MDELYCYLRNACRFSRDESGSGGNHECCLEQYRSGCNSDHQHARRNIHRSDEPASKKEVLLKAGAHHVIVTGKDDVAANVMSITAEKGAEIILDAVGGSKFATLVAAAAERAQYFAYGVLSMEPGVYPGYEVAMKMITIRGYNMTDLMMDFAKSKAAIQFVVDCVTAGKLKPKVDRSFSLDEVADSHRYMEANQQFGKVILVP